jgi:hypothetical protein
MGGTCDTYGRLERCMKGFGSGDLTDSLEDRGVGGSIILKLILKKCDVGGGGVLTGSIWHTIGTGGRSL